MSNRIIGLPPLVDARTRVLVLGSMPGAVSLARVEYYAHPRNRFWQLMELLAGVPASKPYYERLSSLNAAGIGLWDVIGSCERHGSLDSDIARSSEIYNDIAALLDEYINMELVCCNGVKAYKAFKSDIEPRLNGLVLARIEVKSLPSTSPANASFSVGRLMESWSIITVNRARVARRALAAHVNPVQTGMQSEATPGE
jgi:hypoxanthine-DNA glycosylase